MEDNKRFTMTYASEKIERVYSVPVKLIQPGAERQEQPYFTAIWDTGATHTTIRASIAEQLKLPIVGMVPSIHTAGGTTSCTQHKIDLVICIRNREIVLSNVLVNAADLGNGQVDCLIGTDIISCGDFAITNFQGKTTINFRIPSVQDMNFVSAANSKRPYLQEVPPGRNNPCTCGSGRKYKNCCGK